MVKLLIVEDDKILSNMYRIKFINAGHDVKVAENGEVALDLMKSFKPDLVLMDLMMPVMDGFTALTRAKSDPSLKDIPIVILTNLSQTEDAEKTLKMGAKGFIVKSDLTPAEILAKVKPFFPVV
jgi:CheY-like chemotaxis protein